ncbi:MAG: TonB-dependent receptor [Myxococcota bacterium]
MALLVFSSPAWADCDAKVSGHVTDAASGDPVAGARVEVGAASAVSTDDGLFVVRGVCPGPAELHVHHLEYAGFSRAVEVPADHVDIALTVDECAVVVEAPAFSDRDPHARTTVEGEALERSRGQDLGEVLSTVPGVTLLRTSGDATRPMVRGQYGRRLLILFDGMRHESQKWGADHAPEVDPFSADAISVVRGAAGVRYGPDAIGGVILVDPPPLRRDAGVGGRVDVVGVSNGGRGIGAFRLDGSDGHGLGVRIEGDLAKGSSLSAPDYVLGNTASQTLNGAVTLGWTRDGLELEAGFRHHAFDAGICYCVRASSPDELRAALEAGTPPNAALWKTDRTIDRPRQEVTHDLLYAKAKAYVGIGTLEATFNTQLNHRQELEQVRDTVEGPQYDFTLRTHTLDVGLLHDSVHLGSLATLEGTVGGVAQLQDNLFEGLPLVPNHRAASAGAYVAERLSLGHTLVEAGARVDHQHRDTYLTDEAFFRHVGRGTLDADTCTDTGVARRCPGDWSAATVTLGGIWHDAQERVELRLDLSSASRFPNGDELFLNGAAPTQPVYGLGDPGLRTETTWGAAPTLGVHLPGVRGEISAYGNWIDDYIAFGPVLGPDGTPAVDVTVRGSFPRYAFTQTNAVFAGLEGQVEVEATRWVTASLTGAMVRAAERGTGAYLPLVPADRASLTVRVNPPHLGTFDGASVGASVDAVARQDRWDAGTDLGPPPDGYVLLGASASLPVDLDTEHLRFGVEVANLLNARVRSYTSLLRYFADDPGREIRVRAGMDF